MRRWGANNALRRGESFSVRVADKVVVEMVGEEKVVAETPGLVEQTRPDCVIISPEKPGERPNICDALLGLYPDIKILAVTPESNSGFLYSSSSEIHWSCVECSAEGILSALRGKIESKES